MSATRRAGKSQPSDQRKDPKQKDVTPAVEERRKLAELIAHG